jgi:hypothetical protein
LLRTFAERGGGQARQLFYVASQLRTTGEYPQCPVQTFGLDQATADTRRPVRRKTAPDFLVENMIKLRKQFLNPAPKTPAVRGGRRDRR